MVDTKNNYDSKSFLDLTGLMMVISVWWTFTDFFDITNEKILPKFLKNSMSFLSRHKTLHKTINSIIKSWFGRIIFTIISYKLVKKNNNFNSEKVKKILEYTANIGDYSKSSVKEIIEKINLNEQNLEVLYNSILSLDIKKRVRLLNHFIYSMILCSINRSIIKLRYGKRDDYVPNIGVVLFSPIDKCNLKCKGCVTGSDRKGADTPDLKKLNYLVNQMKRLNAYHVVITGKGEPFYDQDSKEKIFALIKKHKDLNFVIYTNGTTLKEEDIKRISKLTNIYLILSVDGLNEINDERRGRNVYKQVINLMGILNKYEMVFGYCSTAHKGNYSHITSMEFIRTMADMGCKFGVYLQFVPIAKDIPINMILNEDDEIEYERMFNEALRQSPIPLVELNMAEKKYGCRARQGTMIHIDGITGKVSPCVKTPFSPMECNIYNNPHKDRFLEILRTNFFTCYRKSFAIGKYCSSKFCDEIEEFLNIPNMSEEELEKLFYVKSNIEKA